MSLSISHPLSLSHTRKRPRTGSYSSPKVVASEAMESDAVRSLAARVPPELFDDILFYVNADRVSQREYEGGNGLERKQGESSPMDILTGLKQCSLVCLFWANRCREHMFSGTTLEIKSYEDADIFRRYFARGCPRLTPVYQLIKDISIHQGYREICAARAHEKQRSFLHLLYLPVIQDKLEYVSITGPVRDRFNPAKLDTPHWGIPPFIVVPSTFLQSNILLRDLHFPSFYHITKYIRHFTCATLIEFNGISWDGQTPTYSLTQASSTIACQRRPRSLEIEATAGCTDSVHLALTALMLNPNCPLHRLSDEERVWMIRLMTLLCGNKKDSSMWIEFDVSEQMTTMRINHFGFVFEEASAPTDQSASALSVVGMNAYIHNYNELPFNFDALVLHARTHPTIRALVLLFDSFGRLQQSLKPYLEVVALATEPIELVLAYEELEERRAVGVDPVILEHNGRIWTELPASIALDPYDENHPKSLNILQRVLEKKSRWSLH